MSGCADSKELLEFECEETDDGQRLDKLLARYLKDQTRSYIAQLIQNGQISVDEKIILKKSFAVSAGQKLSVHIPKAVSLEVPAQDLGVEVLFQDQDLLVLNKPSGMLTHPLHDGEGGTLVSAALHLAENLSGINGVLRPGIVHRLDRETSGVIVCAKTETAHRKLQEDFANRRVQKCYFALVYGNARKREMEVNQPLGRDERRRMLRKVDNGPKGKWALTRFRIIKSWNKFHLVQAFPKTGRTHQIRVHLAYLGFPILGDTQYQGRALSKWLNRVQLHSFSLSVEHPRTGAPVRFCAGLPQDMKSVIKRLNDGESYAG